MKKITLIMMFALPFLGFSQTITNTTFDSNTNGWAANPTASATVSHDATEGSAALGALKLVATVANDRAQTSPNLAPTSGAGDYTLTVKVKGSAGAKVRGAIFQGGASNGAQLTLTGGWDTYTATFTLATADVMNIRLVAIDPGTYFFDDVTWTYVVPVGNTVLTTNIVGAGTLTKSPNQASYTPTTSVTLTATPTTHWMFSNWSGDLTGNANPANVLMNTNKNITANFTVDSGFNYAFLYNTDGNLEGWTTDPQLVVSSHTGGLVTLTPTANQFARLNLFNFPIPSATYNKLTVTLQNNSATTDQLSVVVGSGTGSLLSYPMTTSDTSTQTYEINLTAFPTWTGDVTSLRIRFADADNPDVGKPSDAGTIILNDIIFSFDPALSVADNEYKNVATLYPNPTNSVLNIDTELNINKIEIFNISGQKIFNLENNNSNQVDVSNLPSGAYLINLYSQDTKVKVTKFVKI